MDSHWHSQKQTPLPVAPSVAACLQDPPSQISHKCKHSAAFSAMASIIFIPSSASTNARRKATTGPLALKSLSDQLFNFTDGFWAGMAADIQPHTVLSSPKWKMWAIECAQELETELDNEHLVALIRLFRQMLVLPMHILYSNVMAFKRFE